MTGPVTTALVGYGLGGRVFHLPLLLSSPDYRVKYVTGKTFALEKDRFPGIIPGEVSAVLTDPEVELVVITTPNATHGPLALEALKAGKHVVVDKPFCLSPEEGQEILDAARERGLRVSVFQNRRWDGDFLTVQHLLAQGKLGNLVQIESSFPRFRLGIRDTWKEDSGEGGGILWDLGPHLLDQALVLFGRPLGWKGDFRWTRPGAVTSDDFEITLDYGPSLRVLLKAAMVRPWNGPRFVLHGTKGSYVKYGLDPQENTLKAGGLPGPGWGREPSDAHGSLYTRREDGTEGCETVETLPGRYQDFYARMYRALRFGEALPVDPGEVLTALDILQDLGQFQVAGFPKGN